MDSPAATPISPLPSWKTKKYKMEVSRLYCCRTLTQHQRSHSGQVLGFHECLHGRHRDLDADSVADPSVQFSW
jgi:hypothetical protein